MEPSILTVASLTVGAIINTSSGSADSSSEEILQGLFLEAGVKDARIWSGEGGDMDKIFKEVQAANLGLLVVLGGDGTIRAAAQAVSGTKTLLLPLPGGTMNMLPKALYGNLTWQEVLTQTLAHPKARTISGGTLGNEMFFIAAIIGAPARFAHAREAVRAGKIREALQRARALFRKRFTVRIQYTFDETHTGVAEAVGVICPLISSALPDEHPSFEAAVIDVRTVGQVLGLATAAAFGAWRDDANVTIVPSVRLRISSRRSMPAIVDGELIQIGKKAEAVFIPHAFTAIVPA